MTSDRPAWAETLLAVWREGQDRSMVGPGNPVVHLEIAERLAAVLPEPTEALDLGSGAGIPGLALAGLWPQSRWTLVDAAQRRIRLLEDAVSRLGWDDRVEVVQGRAEELGHRVDLRERFPLVTARSFGPPATTAECGGAFVGLGGTLAVTEPPGSTGERWPRDGLETLGLEALGPEAGVQRLVRRAPLAPRFPRRTGVPAKRPLF